MEEKDLAEGKSTDWENEPDKTRNQEHVEEIKLVRATWRKGSEVLRRGKEISRREEENRREKEEGKWREVSVPIPIPVSVLKVSLTNASSKYV